MRRGEETVKEALRKEIEREKSPVIAVRAMRLGFGVFDDGTAFPCWVVNLTLKTVTASEYGEEVEWVFSAQTGKRIPDGDMKRAPSILR